MLIYLNSLAVHSLSIAAILVRLTGIKRACDAGSNIWTPDKIMSYVYLFSIYSDLFCTSTLSKGKKHASGYVCPLSLESGYLSIGDYHKIKLNLLVVKSVNGP